MASDFKHCKPMDAISLGASTSAVFEIPYYTVFSVHAVWTGDPTGTVKLQMSNDGTNFEDISGATQAAGGAPGHKVFNASGAGYRYVKIDYARSDGTGTMTAYVTAKT